MKDNKLKRAWNYFKGKKRNIGIIALLILKGITLVSPSLIPTEVVSYTNEVINVVLLGGVIDNLRRTTDTGQKVDKAVKDATKNASDTIINQINNLKK